MLLLCSREDNADIHPDAHISGHVAREFGGGGSFEEGVLSNSVIIRNISVKEFLYYIRCEANCFLEKRSNQGRSGDGDIEEDSESKTHDGRRRQEWAGGSQEGGQGLRWSGNVLFACQSSDGNRPQEDGDDHTWLEK